MYETTIYVEARNKHFLNYIKDTVGNKVKDINGVLATLDKEKMSYLSIACDEMYMKPLKDDLLCLVGNVFSLGYKNQYFREKLHIDSDSDLLTDSLINTMCIFDSNLDKKAVTKSLTKCGFDVLGLDGYYNFRLNELKEKWNEIIDLSNANDIILTQERTMREFLKFLIDAIPIQSKMMTVILCEDGNFELMDDNKRMAKLPKVVPMKSIDEEIIYHLICFKPMKVLFIGKNTLSEQGEELIDYLFNVKYDFIKKDCRKSVDFS